MKDGIYDVVWEHTSIPHTRSLPESEDHAFRDCHGYRWCVSTNAFSRLCREQRAGLCHLVSILPLGHIRIRGDERSLTPGVTSNLSSFTMLLKSQLQSVALS